MSDTDVQAAEEAAAAEAEAAEAAAADALDIEEPFAEAANEDGQEEELHVPDISEEHHYHDVASLRKLLQNAQHKDRLEDAARYMACLAESGEPLKGKVVPPAVFREALAEFPGLSEVV